ncbi:MAG: hypothetical protein ACFCU5_01700 [Pleurocapsa sp.]
MNIDTGYIYSFANASLTLRTIEYLRQQSKIPLDSVAVINLIDRWLVQIKLKHSIPLSLAQDFRAFLNEIGIPDNPSSRVRMALQKLEAGASATEVMNRYQVVIVAHGKPEKEEIEVFRRAIVERLGYCPQNMA